jgi:hypothetical protein
MPIKGIQDTVPCWNQTWKIKQNEGQKVISLQDGVPDPGAGQDFSVLEIYVKICSINAKGVSNSGGFSWRIQTEN